MLQIQPKIIPDSSQTTSSPFTIRQTDRMGRLSRTDQTSHANVPAAKDRQHVALSVNKQDSPSQYKQIQCIAYDLNTRPKEWPMSRRYVGNPDEEADCKARVDLVRDAVTQSVDRPGINRSEQCLKVFMMPEFYFRGEKGAYRMETGAKIVDSLREFVNQPKFKDWLFAFGTTVTSGMTEKGPEAYNYSFIQKGNRGEEGSWTVMKEGKSIWDFITGYSKPLFGAPDGMLTLEETEYPPVLESSERSEEKKHNYDGGSIFNCDGLRIGMDICLDHHNGRIKNDIEKNHREKLDVQLITSSGMSIEKENIATRENGVVFLCDGEEKYKTGLQQSGKNVPVAESMTVQNKETLEPCFAGSEAKLTIYDTVDLPRRRGDGIR